MAIGRCFAYMIFLPSVFVFSFASAVGLRKLGIRENYEIDDIKVTDG